MAVDKFKITGVVIIDREITKKEAEILKEKDVLIKSDLELKK